LIVIIDVVGAGVPEFITTDEPVVNEQLGA
jgi:hypothetical protein